MNSIINYWIVCIERVVRESLISTRLIQDPFTSLSIVLDRRLSGGLATNFTLYHSDDQTTARGPYPNCYAVLSGLPLWYMMTPQNIGFDSTILSCAGGCDTLLSEKYIVSMSTRVYTLHTTVLLHTICIDNIGIYIFCIWK